MPAIRRPAAIMFTDIVGYTAMMHHDEQAAVAAVQRHQEVLERFAARHGGEVLQYYGDGSLTIFDGPAEALRCAMDVQQALRETPRVPLRIGIHSGEILLEGKKALGDAINLASRLESIGQEGTVLFSKAVFENIRMQSEFKAVSLGDFEFKHIDEPVEVFALANEGYPVPKREDMAGKLKPVPAGTGNKYGRSNLRWLLPSGILLLAAVAFLWMRLKTTYTLPVDIREARIAVLPYQNNTNDPALDVVGEMAADWIIQGMMSLEDVQVVSYQTIQEVVKDANPLMDIKFRPAFQRKTGARKVIRGTYYREGDLLIFHSQIIDVLSGNVEFVFPEIKGPADRVMDLVSELRQRMLGYFMVVKDKNILLPDSKPPKYEAYKAFLEAYSYYGIDYERSRELCNLAISIDSSFLWPYLSMAGSFYNQGNIPGVDSVISLITRRFARLNSYESAYLEWAKTMSTSDLNDDYQMMKPIFRKDPKNLRNNYLMGYSASQLNKPLEAIGYFSIIDPKDLNVKYQAQTWWHIIYAYNLIRLRRLEEAMEVLRFVPEELATWAYYYRKSDIFVLRDQEDSIRYLIDDLENRNAPNDLIVNLYVNVAIRYLMNSDTARQTEWFRLATDRIRSQPESIAGSREILASVYYFSGQFNLALPYYRDQIRSGNAAWYNLARLGSIYARLGEPEKAGDIIRRLEALDTPGTQGRFRYAIALVRSMLGEKVKAVEDMKTAFRAGFGFTSSRYDNAFEFLPLRAYPPFEDFVSPDG